MRQEAPVVALTPTQHTVPADLVRHTPAAHTARDVSHDTGLSVSAAVTCLQALQRLGYVGAGRPPDGSPSDTVDYLPTLTGLSYIRTPPSPAPRHAPAAADVAAPACLPAVPSPRAAPIGAAPRVGHRWGCRGGGRRAPLRKPHRLPARGEPPALPGPVRPPHPPGAVGGPLDHVPVDPPGVPHVLPPSRLPVGGRAGDGRWQRGYRWGVPLGGAAPA